MTRADPQGLRAEAVGMLIRLLPRGAYAGVWTYAGAVNMLVPHGQADSAWKTAALEQTAQLPAVGTLANLPGAIAQATWDAERASGRQRQVLLISDGAVRIDERGADAGPGSWAARTATGLRAGGIKVHTLKLPGPDEAPADPVLLKQLSVATGGHYFQVKNLRGLRQALVRVMDGITPAPQLPVTDKHGFLVDPGLSEITVLRLKEGMDPELTLTRPDGQTMTRSSANLSFRWHESTGYDLITLTNPQPGRWRFSGAMESGRVVGVGDLTLAARGLPANVVPGLPKSVELQLMDGGKPLTDPAFLALVRIEARVIGEKSQRPMVVSRTDDGRFQLQMRTFEEQGDYSIRVRAHGPTFERELSLPFSVRHPVALRVLPDVSGGVAWVEVNSADVDFSSVSVSGRLSRPPQGAIPLTGLPFPAGLWKLPLTGPAGIIELALSIKGNHLNNKEFMLKTDPVVLSLPVAEERLYQFDLNGVSLVSAEISAPQRMPPAAAERAVAGAEDAEVTVEEPLRLPVWFALLLGIVNLLAGLAAWLLLKPPPPPRRFLAALEELELLLTPAASEAG